MANIPDNFINKFYLEPTMSFAFNIAVYPTPGGEQYIRIIGGGNEYIVSTHAGYPQTLKFESEINNSNEFQEWTYQSGNKNTDPNQSGGSFMDNYQQFSIAVNGLSLTLWRGNPFNPNKVGDIDVIGMRH
jgi:hypothetical protein